MKIATQIRLEEVLMWVTGISLFYVTGVEWWWYLLVLLGPDISMLGYLAGNKTGAGLYNFFHSKAVGLACVMAGMFTEHPYIGLIGVVIVAHSAFDRMMGYGLKYDKGFKYTHLGVIGKKSGE